MAPLAPPGYACAQRTRTRFAVLELRSDEFAVHSCLLLCLSAEASCETCVQIVLPLDFIE